MKGKKSKQPKFKVYVELAYTLPEFLTKETSLDKADYEKLTEAHQNDSVKKCLTHGVRANLSYETKTNGILGELIAECKNFCEQKDIAKSIEIAIELQTYFSKFREWIKTSLPNYVTNVDSIAKPDPYNYLRVTGKNSVGYNTNMYNWLDIYLAKDKAVEVGLAIENDILLILQKIVDEKLEAYFDLHAHFSSWAYYINGRPVVHGGNAINISEFITHRRANVQL